MKRASVSVGADHGTIMFREGDRTESFPIDALRQVIRIEFGGDMIGPARNSFWVFDLGDGAVVAPDCPPELRRTILPLLAPSIRPGIRRMEGSCFVPPKRWARRHVLLPPDEVALQRISARELQETLLTLGDLHAVQDFGEESL